MNQTATTEGKRSEAPFERKLSVTGPVMLVVSARSGRVRVRRGEEGSVTIRGVIRAQPSIFSWRHPHVQVERLASSPPVQQSGNTIQIGDVADRWLLRGVHLVVDIAAPAATRFRAIANSADLRVEGIDGPVDCETDSGQIQIHGIHSEVSASSDSGSIHIREVADSVDTRTDSGEIEVLEVGGGIDAHSDCGNIRLSQSVAAPVYACSDSGRISIQLAASGGYTIKARTVVGRIEFPEAGPPRSAGREMEGSIRGGGPVVALETDSGDIEIGGTC